MTGDLFSPLTTLRRGYFVQEIDAPRAKAMVMKYHYSGKVVPNSKLHLGVFNSRGEICGVLSYGPPMNGARTAKKISHSERMYELNRMVMRDEEPRNSESMAISACNKWLKKNTDVEYILSFSDGKEGNVGYIYQATNWKYLGHMWSDSFYECDNKIMHSVTVWHKYKEKHPLRDVLTTDEIVSMYFANISRILCKQHVYVFPLNKKVKFLHSIKDYPKKDKEVPIIRRTIIKSDRYPKGAIIVYGTDSGADLFNRNIRTYEKHSSLFSRVYYAIPQVGDSC